MRFSDKHKYQTKHCDHGSTNETLDRIAQDHANIQSSNDANNTIDVIMSCYPILVETMETIESMETMGSMQSMETMKAM